MTGSIPLCSPSQALSRLRPGNTVFVPGVSGESLPFFDALRSEPERASGLTFVGVHFPGINRSDYLALHPSVRQRAYFMTPAIRKGLQSDRADWMPLDYPGIVRDLEENVTVDVAVAQVSTPDADGRCSLGASCDFLPSVWQRARLRIAHINPSLPRTQGSFAVQAGDCHLGFEYASPIPMLTADAADEPAQRQARLVAGLVRDGDTLQFGVGKLQAAVLHSLTNHRGLKVYSGMASSPVTQLIDSGTIRGRGAIEIGVALGDEAFYQRVGADETFFFRPVRETHDVRRIATIDNFCAINSALSVDLFGQVNAESIEGRWVAGAGGLPAFSAGARLSAGGRSIIALAATADGGKVSRIHAAMGPGCVTIPRHEADYVVTEYGIADLRGRSLQDRAQALIRIAAPAFQPELSARWLEMKKLL
jgi:acyl-CoA hydrolase